MSVTYSVQIMTNKKKQKSMHQLQGNAILAGISASDLTFSTQCALQIPTNEWMTCWYVQLNAVTVKNTEFIRLANFQLCRSTAGVLDCTPKLKILILPIIPHVCMSALIKMTFGTRSRPLPLQKFTFIGEMCHPYGVKNQFYTTE